MLVEVKEWESISKKGHPRAQIFQRLVHGGDVLEIPDTLVTHERDSDTEFEPELEMDKDGVVKTDSKGNFIPKLDPKTGEPILRKGPGGKPIPKKERIIEHPAVRVSANPNADTVEMTELEHRKFTIAKSPAARRWSKQDKELFLKYFWYTPDWMKPASRNARPTVNKEDSEPSQWGRDIPNVQPGALTSVGNFDTGQYVGKLANLSEAEAILNVNKTDNMAILDQWLHDEQGPNGRPAVVNIIKAQMKNGKTGGV